MWDHYSYILNSYDVPICSEGYVETTKSISALLAELLHEGNKCKNKNIYMPSFQMNIPIAIPLVIDSYRTL